MDQTNLKDKLSNDIGLSSSSNSIDIPGAKIAQFILNYPRFNISASISDLICLVREAMILHEWLFAAEANLKATEN